MKGNDMNCAVLNNCSFKPIVNEIHHAAPDDRELQEREIWEEIHESSEDTGDTIGDYDGPLTWA